VTKTSGTSRAGKRPPVGMARQPRRLYDVVGAGSQRARLRRVGPLSDLHVYQVSEVVPSHPLHVEPELHHKAVTCRYVGASQHHPSTGFTTKYKKIQDAKTMRQGCRPRMTSAL
jgi:hypothetical protein